MDAPDVTTFKGLAGANNPCVLGELRNQVIEERQVVSIGVVAVEPGENRHRTSWGRNHCQ
jgi:hypothetical protein